MRPTPAACYLTYCPFTGGWAVELPSGYVESFPTLAEAVDRAAGFPLRVR